MFTGLFLIIAVIAIIAYNSGWRPQGQNNLFATANNNQSPLDIAKERFARGEIGQEEYEVLRRNLEA